MVIKPQFERTDAFSEGLAVMVIDRQYGYIDQTGNIIIHPQLDSAQSFREGLAMVSYARS
jgi:hypothetical protein